MGKIQGIINAAKPPIKPVIKITHKESLASAGSSSDRGVTLLALLSGRESALPSAKTKSSGIASKVSSVELALPSENSTSLKLTKESVCARAKLPQEAKNRRMIVSDLK